MADISSNAERFLLFQFVMEKGLPEWADGDQLKVFGKISGLSEQEVCNAAAELEDAGLIFKDGD